MSDAGYDVEAIILSSKPLGERDRLITAITPDRGLLRFAARGTQSPGSKLAHAILPFSRVSLSLWRGKSLDGLRGGEVVESHRPLRESPDLLAHAYCMAEVGKLMAREGEADRALYLLVATAANMLEGLDPDLVLAFYLVRAVKVAGLFPQLDECARCSRPTEGGFLSFESGAVSCGECPREPGFGERLSPGLPSLAVALRDIHPRRLGEVKVSREIVVELRELMLDYLEHHAGRSVNSRRFLDILA